MIRILVFGLSTGMGGVETYLMNLYRNIDRSKLQFDFVVSGKSCYYSDEINRLGGEIYYITPKRENIFREIIDLLKILIKCKKTHRVVYFNFSSLDYNLPFIFTKILRFPVVMAHGHSSRQKGTKKTMRYYLHCLNRKYVSYASNYLFACSEVAAEWVLGRKVIEKGLVTIIPNAIPTYKYIYSQDVRDNIRNELGIKENQFVVGNVGRMSYVKNQMFLIDIFYDIAKRDENAVLLLVGDGELRFEIEKRISNLSLDKRVILTGTRPDVPNLLQAMDAFVLPSLFEGLPFVLIEAQASGLKCFASNDVITTESNITNLVEFINLHEKPDYWAEKIMNLSKVYNRKNMTQNIKSAGFDIEEMAKKMERFILDNIVYIKK